MPAGSSSRSSQAKTSAASTSVRATNDASRDPSRRLAAIPATYASAAVTTPSAKTGTHHGTVLSTNVTDVRGAANGTTPTSPATSSAAPPHSRPPAASTSGGRPLSSSADMTKYAAAPSIAASAHTTPATLRSAPETRSSTSTRPTAATIAPTTVSNPGRWPCRSHSHPMTATGAVYSISNATPTCMWSTALKYASWHPATAMTPYETSSAMLSRTRYQRPRSEIRAGTSKAAAAIRI